MTLPNLISILRIILAPMFVIYLLDDRLLPALFVFILAGISDGVDGFVARLFNQKSKLGSYLDPVADKLLLIAAFIVLAGKGIIPAWLSVIVISRDVLILLGVSILFLNDVDFTIKPSIVSKLTTVFQLTAVVAVLSKTHVHFISPFCLYLFWATGILTIVSGLHYIRWWLRKIGEGPPNSQKQEETDKNTT